VEFLLDVGESIPQLVELLTKLVVCCHHWYRDVFLGLVLLPKHLLEFEKQVEHLDVLLESSRFAVIELLLEVGADKGDCSRCSGGYDNDDCESNWYHSFLCFFSLLKSTILYFKNPFL